MTFGENLKAQMCYKKVNAKELSMRSGVTESAISMIIKGKRQPRLDTIILLADGLKINVCLLLQGLGEY